MIMSFGFPVGAVHSFTGLEHLLLLSNIVQPFGNPDIVVHHHA